MLGLFVTGAHTASATGEYTTDVSAATEPTASGGELPAQWGSPSEPTASLADNITEEEHLVPAPTEGDPFHEATAPDGSWISYVNPRDEYRSPYLGDGSAKICITLRNERGEVIVGESVPETRVTIPTGETLSWHSAAGPIAVRFPLTSHYDRPLDADQFGTSDELSQGDGYLDSHCIEFHGLSSTASIEYGEAAVDGAFADRIEVIGYVQQAGQAWDTDLDPIAEAEPYAATGGGWTFEPNASHGQVVVVLQLDTAAKSEDRQGAADATGAAPDLEPPTRSSPAHASRSEATHDPVPSVESLATDAPDEHDDAPTASGPRGSMLVVASLAAIAIALVVAARRR